MNSILNLISRDFTVIKESKNVYTTEEHDSLKIWINTNTFTWFTKKISGGLSEWIRFVLHDKPENYDIYDYNIDVVFDDENHYDYEQIHGNHIYHPYFKKRGLSKEIFKKYHLEVYNNSILIPILDRKGKRIGANIRTLNDNAKYRYQLKINGQNNNHIWPMNILNILDYDDTILVFEGCFSAMRFDQVLGNKVKCFALFGSSASYALKSYFNRIDNIIFILDNDEGGIKLKDRILKINNNWKYDFPIKYPDEMTKQEIQMYATKVLKI